MDKYLNNLEVNKDVVSFAEETRQKYIEQIAQRLFANPKKMQKMVDTVLMFCLEQIEQKINHKASNPEVIVKLDDFKNLKEFEEIEEHDFAVITKVVEELYKKAVFGYRIIAADAKLMICIDIVY